MNGQAPPGIITLEELGRWRCGGCGAWNGEESAAKKALADIKAGSGPAEAVSDTEADVEHPSSVSTAEGTDDGVIVTKEEDQDQVESGSSSGAETHGEEVGDAQEDEEEAQPEPVPVSAPKTRSQNATRRRGRKG